MKVFLIIATSICLIGKADLLIEIKAIPEDQLRNFMLYQSKMLVSPFKSEEELRSPPIVNYMPVKFKLVNNPEINIQESAEGRRARELRMKSKIRKVRKALL